jgi:hypothetical protein
MSFWKKKQQHPSPPPQQPLANVTVSHTPSQALAQIGAKDPHFHHIAMRSDTNLDSSAFSLSSFSDFFSLISYLSL